MTMQAVHALHKVFFTHLAIWTKISRRYLQSHAEGCLSSNFFSQEVGLLYQSICLKNVSLQLTQTPLEHLISVKQIHYPLWEKFVQQSKVSFRFPSLSFSLSDVILSHLYFVINSVFKLLCSVSQLNSQPTLKSIYIPSTLKHEEILPHMQHNVQLIT